MGANEYYTAVDRPNLGFEYEIALALIDTEADLQFNETVVSYQGGLDAFVGSIISGDFEPFVIVNGIRFDPPNSAVKPLKCGYNPAAQLIPTVSIMGTLGFKLYDTAVTNRAMYYNGQVCVARIITRYNYNPVRTVYCLYWTPNLITDSGRGEEIGESTLEGPFSILAI